MPVVATAAGGTEEQSAVYASSAVFVSCGTFPSRDFLEASAQAAARRGARLRQDGQAMRDAVAAPATERFATALREARVSTTTTPSVVRRACY